MDNRFPLNHSKRLALLEWFLNNKEIKEDQTLLNGNWELAGASFSKDLSKDFKEGLPTLTFESAENLTVYGYDGCNRINGKAVLKKNQEINFPSDFTNRIFGSIVTVAALRCS